MVQIHDTDYNKYVNLIGTAHFTRRSLNDAYEAITSLKPRDVALELDWRRFTQLNTACLNCLQAKSCKGICEFIGATEALGNTNANIWLIDMTEREMQHRMRRRMTPYERSRRRIPLRYYADEDPVGLWERGYKERVINDSKRHIETGRKYFPSVWRVLIDERNALMAARLAWITSKNLDEATYICRSCSCCRNKRPTSASTSNQRPSSNVQSKLHRSNIDQKSCRPSTLIVTETKWSSTIRFRILRYVVTTRNVPVNQTLQNL
jgi:hypothetical protein